MYVFVPKAQTKTSKSVTKYHASVWNGIIATDSNNMRCQRKGIELVDKNIYDCVTDAILQVLPLCGIVI